MTVGSCNKQNVENTYLLNLKLDLVFRYEIFSSQMLWLFGEIYFVFLDNSFLTFLCIFSPLFLWLFFAWSWNQSLGAGSICRTIGPLLLKKWNCELTNDCTSSDIWGIVHDWQIVASCIARFQLVYDYNLWEH